MYSKNKIISKIRMTHIQQRIWMFLIGCIGLRFLFVVVAKYIPIKYLKYLGYLALLPAIGFMYIFVTGSRKTGSETFGEKIWWNNLRPIHALFYFLFAYNAISDNKQAWIYLLVDVIFGLISFLIYHFNQGNFNILL
jgi:hypothetical protein